GRVSPEHLRAEMGRGAVAASSPLLTVSMMAAFGPARTGHGGARAAEQTTQCSATRRGLAEAAGQSVKRLRVHGHRSCRIDAVDIGLGKGTPGDCHASGER